MTAVVSREHARATCLTGAAGVLMIAIAVMMMVVAAPAHVHARPQGSGKPSAAQLTTDVCHQLTSRSDPATVRACRADPAAEKAWADAYVADVTGRPPRIFRQWAEAHVGAFQPAR